MLEHTYVYLSSKGSDKIRTLCLCLDLVYVCTNGTLYGNGQALYMAVLAEWICMVKGRHSRIPVVSVPAEPCLSGKVRAGKGSDIVGSL